MPDELQRRVQVLEAQVAGLIQASTDTLRLLSEQIAHVNSGTVQTISLVLEEMIADGTVDRNRLILVLERYAEHAEDAARNGMQRLPLDGLLMLLRRAGEPPGA